MLLDNTKREDCEYTVFDFIKQNTESGSIDIVTGYFSVNALAQFKDQINSVNKFRLILGKLMQEEPQADKIIDLLNGNISIQSALSLSQSAQKAVEFLQQSNVHVKSIQKNFCHAKAYLYTDKDKIRNYFIVGSSNLTDAGLGIKHSSNIELNIAKHDYEDEFKNLQKWFQKLWDEEALETIELPDKTKVKVKQYLIELIKTLFKKYTPCELYYKVLYEIFKNDITDLSENPEFRREILHLEETTIYKSLYPYQQRGVISLIKMLQKFNGAILADAVGLGKTWTALAVMKYFELKGYTVLLLCPKKLANNWHQYTIGQQSRFEKDEIDFYIRYHTDLQDTRFDRYTDKPLRFFQTRPKLLVVIDESHNLRNDKSSRYQFLVEQLLLPQHKSRDVKVLQLSATPINNKLIDIRNQFKLITKGLDNGFKNTELEVESLRELFKSVEKSFKNWVIRDDRKISEFIATLPRQFEKLTDSLIVARTRELIQDELNNLKFPQKAPPINEFISPDNIGDLKSFDDILDAISINLTAYRPADYIDTPPPKSVLEDERQRQRFLVKMMYILLIKRLESSWFSFKCTVKNILHYHRLTLNKIEQFLKSKADSILQNEFTEEEQEALDETADALAAAALATDDETAEYNTFTLGKNTPIHLSSITHITSFKKHLEDDINKLSRLESNLDYFEQCFNTNTAQDKKLNKLIEHITHKQNTSSNKKVLVFTAFKDTAEFLYEQLKKRGFSHLAFVSGSVNKSADGYSSQNFESILERFAPYTKLYNEKDWSDLYMKHLGAHSSYFKHNTWNVPYEVWLDLIKTHDPNTYEKIQNPIDVLIATDCISEGQNLQDCDMVINYDIHWNPVRLIQRMGRIDRLGSPNRTITGINFWPSKDYEDYLNLKSRIENRMALMTIAGTELDETLSPELQKIVDQNPLLPRQAQKMLEQLNTTWNDIETNDDTLGFNDLSLEQFRQELFEFFKRNEEFFKKIPNGVFTGFKFQPSTKWQTMPNSIIAVLGYPKRPDEALNHTYRDIYLMHQPIELDANPTPILANHQEILALLRHHKLQPRYVPQNIENAEPDILHKLSRAIGSWLNSQVAPVAISQIQDLFNGHASPTHLSPEQKKLEDKFKAENFDLITWFILSNNQ